MVRHSKPTEIATESNTMHNMYVAGTVGEGSSSNGSLGKKFRGIVKLKSSCSWDEIKRT